MTTSPKFASAAAALAAICSLAPAGGGLSQTRQSCTDDAMLVFDASGSMAEMGYNGLDAPRIVEARAALRDALPDITPYRRLGLIVYGPGSGDSCANIDLRFLPRRDAAGVIIADVDRVQPDGETPLTQSVRNAADALHYKTRPATIVLVTDGKETCGGSPCLLAAELAQTGPGLTVHVIGFRVRSAFFAWKDSPTAGFGDGETVARCLADSTGGHYVSTENTEDLVRALQLTLGCPLYGQASRWRRTG